MKAFLLLLAASMAANAEGLDPQVLTKSVSSVWGTYNGDHSGRRYSLLSQVNQSNVKNLALAWAFQAKSVPIKSTPLMVDGIRYFTVPDHVYAVDARTGRQIWHYAYKARGGDHIGHRGVAMYGNWLYFETPRLPFDLPQCERRQRSLGYRDGGLEARYFSTMAPLVVKNHVIAGVSGDVTDIPGFLLSVDPETGKVQWKWNTAPNKGEPGSETWPAEGDAISHGGGMTWMTGTYDPELNLVYWGTGNPNPVLAGEGRKGDNLWTCSIVAVNPDTGKLVWYFQPSPHDTHDWDAVQTPIVFNGTFNGQPRKLVAQASRNGYFFVLDRATGKNLLTAPFIESNWASGIDKIGRPIPRVEKEPTPDGALVSRDRTGLRIGWLPAFRSIRSCFT